MATKKKATKKTATATKKKATKKKATATKKKATKKKATATKKKPTKKATKKTTAMSRPGLFANINKRKREGTSRPKSASTVTPSAYAAMQDNWGRPGKKTTRKTTET